MRIGRLLGAAKLRLNVYEQFGECMERKLDALKDVGKTEDETRTEPECSEDQGEEK